MQTELPIRFVPVSVLLLAATAVLASCSDSNRKRGAGPMAGGFSVTSLDPAGTAVGSGPLSIDVRGTGFFAGLEVQVEGISQATTFVDDTTLSVAVPAAALTAASVARVRVYDPLAMAVSTELDFEVVAVPVVAGLDPASAFQGSGSQTIRVLGTDYRPAAMAAWGGSTRPTTFISDTELEMQLTAADLAASGAVDVTVLDPFGGTSNASGFNVLAAPVLEVGVVAMSTVTTAGDQSLEMFPVHTGFTSAGTIDGTGARVAWPSSAGDFILDDTNASVDVFLRDHSSGTTERVFLDAAGMEIFGGEGLFPALSADGGSLAFLGTGTTLAPLIPGDLGLFLRDLASGAIELVSVDPLGDPAPGSPFRCPDLSGDGQYVAFEWDQDTLLASDFNAHVDIFVRDVAGDQTEIVSVSSFDDPGDGDSKRPAISQNGRFVVFDSEATTLTLLPNPDRSVFLHDRQTGTTEVISLDPMGMPADGDSRGADVSADGRYVVFESQASTLVANDTNGTTDIFVRDRMLGTTTLVSRHTDGTQGIGSSSAATISSDGQLIAFASRAPNLVDDDTNASCDVFVHDQATGTTRRVSVTSEGNQAAQGANAGTISADGRYVVLLSDADDLHDPDVNGLVDLFLARTGRP